MITTAVILAAGLGSRLKDRTKDIPKGFLEIDGETLIGASVRKLLEAGINRIIIGTGYHSEIYDDFASHHPQIQCIKNEQYASSGSMCTLYCLKEALTEDFLVLESDLLYDKAGLKFLLDSPDKNVILSSGATQSNDEVFIEVDKMHNLVNLSKKREELGSIYSELVGISKISIEFYSEMCKAFEDSHNLKMEYEVGMVKASSKIPIKVLKIDDYVWCEIDDESHLNRAIAQIKDRVKMVEQNKVI